MGGRNTKRVVLAVLLAGAAALLAPVSNSAAATFGADLSQPVTETVCSGPQRGCSVLNRLNPGGEPENGSPITGVLVSVSLKHRGDPQNVVFRVLRPTGVANQYHNVGPEISAALPAVGPGTGQVDTFSTRRPIQAGDRLGLGVISPPTGEMLPFANVSGALCSVRIEPTTLSQDQHPADTDATYPDCSLGLYLLISGTVEEDADGDGFGDKTQDKNAPGLAGVSVSPKTFRVDSSGAPAASKRAPKGTTFKYTISKATKAKVTFTIEKKAKAKGRKVRGKCVRRKRSNRRKPKCTRYTAAGSLTQDAVGGANSKAFSGKIGSRKLGRGSYRATLVARDAAGNASVAARISFKVVRR